MNNQDINVADLIEKLGGTNATAKLCEVSPPSVSEWKANNRIPKSRLMFLRLAKPDAFKELREKHAA